MATIALLFCAALIFFLLSVDKRESHGVSPGVWLPTLWLIIAASRPLIDWTTSSEVMAHGAYTNSNSPLDRWTLTALGILGVIVLAKRRFDWYGIAKRNSWLFVLLAYMFLSTFWSDITLIAMKRWVRELVVVIMALVLSSEVNPRQALAAVFRRTAYVLLPLSLLLIRYYPIYGRVYGRYSGVEMWTGVTEQKNQLGRLCMVSVLVLFVELYQLWRSRRSKVARRQLIADIVVISLAVYLLIGSHSATSLTTTLLGLLAFLGLNWMYKRRRISQIPLFATVLFLIGFGVATPFLGGTNIGAFTATLDRDSTLTGRTQIWASVMPARNERSLFGYGIGSFWTAARRNLYEIPTAHNGYLDALLDFGEFGFLVCTAWILFCAGKFHRASMQDPAWASLSICLLYMFLLYNITESALNSMTDYMSAIIVFSVLAVPHKAFLKRVRARRTNLPDTQPAPAENFQDALYAAWTPAP